MSYKLVTRSLERKNNIYTAHLYNYDGYIQQSGIVLDLARPLPYTVTQ